MTAPLVSILKKIKSFENFASNIFRADGNKVIKNVNNARADKIAKNLSNCENLKKIKSKKWTYIQAIKELIFLIFDDKKLFII